VPAARRGRRKGTGGGGEERVKGRRNMRRGGFVGLIDSDREPHDDDCSY